MKITKPNHVCKYSGCTLGENNTPKKYYACDYCDRTESWRSAACCIEHYELYVQEVLAARAKNRKVDTLPNRIDKSKDEVKKIIEAPLDEVKEKTQEELKDYIDGSKTIEEAVESINDEIDKSTKRNKKRTKK